VTPGKKHHSRVRVDGANVVRNCLKKKGTPPLMTSSEHSLKFGRFDTTGNFNTVLSGKNNTSTVSPCYASATLLEELVHSLAR